MFFSEMNHDKENSLENNIRRMKNKNPNIVSTITRDPYIKKEVLCRLLKKEKISTNNQEYSGKRERILQGLSTTSSLLIDEK